jgi:hypothetical protein
MNENLNKLANAVAAPRRPGRISEIRKYFDLYMRNMDEDKTEGAGIITLMVGAVSGAGIALFFAWLIWGY